MSCEEFRERIIDMAAGELSPKYAGRVKRHCEGCADCARELAETELLLGAAQQGLEMKAPALKLPAAEVRPARRGWRIPGWIAAAGMLAAAFAGASFGYIEGREGRAAPAHARVRVADTTSDFWDVQGDAVARLKSFSREHLEPGGALTGRNGQ